MSHDSAQTVPAPGSSSGAGAAHGRRAADGQRSPPGAAAAPRPFACSGSVARGLAMDAAWCAGIALALTLLTTPFVSFGPASWPVIYVVFLLITTGIGMTCSNLYRWVFPRMVARRGGRLAQIAAHAAIIVVSAVAGGEIGLRLVEALLPVQMAEARLGVIQIGLTVCTIVVLLALANEGLHARARELELQAERASERALRAQLAALRARTDPHFLFNSLNTVAGLIEDEPRKAERMLELLASQVRYSLESSRRREVPLGEELDAVRDYLEMQSIRFGERLRTSVSVDDGVLDARVPPLVLQPLVENAVLHGVSSRPEGGRIDVELQARDAELVLTVTDDGPGPGGSPHSGSGTSLSDLSERLRLEHGERASVEVGAAPEGGFRVQIALPIVTEESP